MQNNYLMVCSNQVRQNADAGPYGQRFKSPGGEAIGFYASLRLRFGNPTKIKAKERFRGKEITRVIGVETEVEIFKSSVWKPYRTAPVTIIFDYGIDDIRQNLQFVKTYTKHNIYTVNGQKLQVSLDGSVRQVEEEGLAGALKEEVIDLWEAIERRFESPRKAKIR